MLDRERQEFNESNSKRFNWGIGELDIKNAYFQVPIEPKYFPSNYLELAYWQKEIENFYLTNKLSFFKPDVTKRLIEEDYKKMLRRCSVNHTDWEFRFMGRTNHELVESRKLKHFERKFVWIADSGASAHMTWINEGFLKINQTNIKAQFGRRNNKVAITTCGTWKGRVFKCQNNNPQLLQEITDLEMDIVIYVQDLHNNLFSLTSEI